MEGSQVSPAAAPPAAGHRDFSHCTIVNTMNEKINACHKPFASILIIPGGDHLDG
jgi:hypothetical protein